MATLFTIAVYSILGISCVLRAVMAVDRYGDVTQGAVFPCRCSDGCDPDNGTCLQNGSCLDGEPRDKRHRWHGHGCRIGNVAFRRHAYQKGTWVLKGNVSATADLAVDGDTNPDQSQYHCAHPGNKSSSDPSAAWWYVDLGTYHVIYSVTLFNVNREVFVRMSEFRITVGNTTDIKNGMECVRHQGPVTRGGHLTLNCTTTMTGRYVAYVSERTSPSDQIRYVSICEFVVTGRLYVDCSHCPPPATCDDYDGCSSCPNGTRLPNCTRSCISGWYGENCEARCSDHCKPDSDPPCKSVSGVCTDGCTEVTDVDKDVWWLGDRCDTRIDKVLNTAITRLTVTAASSTTVILEWHYSESISDNVAPYIGYQVYRKVNDSQWSREQNVSHQTTDKHQLLVVGLEPETSYHFGLSVYRVYTDGKAYEGSGKYPEANVTTLSELTSAMTSARPSGSITEVTYSPTVKATSSPGINIGVIAGPSVAFTVLLGVGITAAVLITLRRSSRRKENKNQSSSGEERVGPADESSVVDNLDNPDAAEDSEEDDVGDIDLEVADQGGSEERDQMYQNFGVVGFKSTAIKIKNLRSFVVKQSKTDFFQLEFESVLVEYPLPCLAAEEAENKDKDRFKNIKSYDKTRVVLDVEDDSTDSTTDYINANFLTGVGYTDKAYVATQAPTPHTLTDFWRMMWQLKANRIVMLTKVIENGVRKCGNYWSDGHDAEKKFGHFTVRVVSCDVFTEYALRIMQVIKGEETRTVHHLQFLKWPDKLAPDETYPLLAFRRKVRSFDMVSSGPLVVHCSAGVGRTGTFIAIDQLVQQAAIDGEIDVLSLLRKLRSQRSHVIQTTEQYKFVYEAIVEATRFRDGPFIPCSNMSDVFKELISKQVMGKTGLEKQYQFLRQMCPKCTPDESAMNEENLSKNRDSDILPCGSRPFLSTRTDDGNDYINAVFLDTYKIEKGLIATQMPLPNTIVDFWRLIYDHECGCIVLLQNEDILDETCPVYWPQSVNSNMTFGPFEVTLVKENNTTDVSTREFSLINTRKTREKARTVAQFEMSDWPQSKDLPTKAAFVNLYDRVETWRLEASNTTTVVQCLDGATRCGLFCAATYLIQKMAADQELDVFNTVRCIASNRSQFIDSVAQYGYLHELAIHYHDSYAEYQNI